MIIAIASGKGGTGKTTLATNLAMSLARRNQAVQLLDCDVEEPNCHLFLRPVIEMTETISLPVPEVDRQRCTGCGECGRICQFSAILSIKDVVLTFPELCHGCGGCGMVCPEGAISEVPREIGVLEEGQVDGIQFVHGRLRIGEAMSPPLIREVKERISLRGTSVIDAPPGTSCPVIEAVKGSDVCLLVTEPTPFGLNDLKLAVGMVRALELPHAVIINRADVGDREVLKYCRREEIDVLLEIPNDRRIAESYSRGELIVDALPEYREDFQGLLEKIFQLRSGKEAMV
ncbi:ATP-binding protein [Candidatus Zixiibacteriota bacterium]